MKKELGRIKGWEIANDLHRCKELMYLLVREVLLYDSDFMLIRTGTYVTIKLMVDAYQSGSVGAPFACRWLLCLAAPKDGSSQTVQNDHVAKLCKYSGMHCW
jgi:hypothetical protein